MKPDYAVYTYNCGLERYKALASANYCIRERGRINETNYQYSIISPPILLAKPNLQKRGGVILSEYGIYMMFFEAFLEFELLQVLIIR